MESLLRQIESAARISLLKTREFVEFGPFCAYFDALSDLIWLNYAAPVWAIESAAQLRSAMRDLRDEFARRKRRLRFEFIEPLWPTLAEALLRAGLVLQADQPLMVCSSVDLVMRRQKEIRILELSAADDDATLATYERVAAEGFAGLNPPAPSDESRRRLREELRSGVRRAVLGWIGQEPAGVAAISPMGATAELVGVTTLQRFRRRRIASTLSAHLVNGHFGRGGELAWLSANDALAQSTYRSIGFADAGNYANYIAPEGAT